MDYNIFLKFAISLVIGTLVGLQREYAFESEDKELTAGIRTMALMGMIGCAAAMLSSELGSAWPFVIIILLGGLLLALGFYTQAQADKKGLTTEFAALLTMLAGSLVYLEFIALAVALTVAITAILSFKIEMHQFVRNLTREDIIAVIKFAMISAIILPVLPNKEFGPEPLNVFNPYKIWLLVVFISGISFVGYVLIKIIGPRKGIGLLGLLGGLASSTAVTLTLTQRSRTNPTFSASFAQAVILAWTVMYIRLVVIVVAVNRSLFKYLWLPVLMAVVVGLLYALFLYTSQKEEPSSHDVNLSNPFELSPAIKFGIIFSLVLLLSKVAKTYLGDAGIYIAGAVSGLADVDAIALSVADLSSQQNGLDEITAARTILVATVSNTFLKGMAVVLGGTEKMRHAVIGGMILISVTVLLFVFFG